VYIVHNEFVPGEAAAGPAIRAGSARAVECGRPPTVGPVRSDRERTLVTTSLRDSVTIREVLTSWNRFSSCKFLQLNLYLIAKKIVFSTHKMSMCTYPSEGTIDHSERSLRIGLIAILSCTDRLTIHDFTPDYRVRMFEAVTHSELFKALSSLQIGGRSWKKTSLTDVCAKIYELEQSCETSSNSQKIIQNMLVQSFATYQTTKTNIIEMVNRLACMSQLDVDGITAKCRKQTAIIQTFEERYRENYRRQRKTVPLTLSGLNDRIRVLNSAMKKMEFLCFNRKYLTDVLSSSYTVDNSSLCETMTIAGIMVEFNESEVYKMLCQYCAWKILPFAMSLHKRLGKGSLLGLLDEELIKTILRYYVENDQPEDRA
jgi:hypothetical protein